MNKTHQAQALMLTGIFCFSTIEACVKWLNAGLAADAILFWRSLLIAPFLLFLLFQGITKGLRSGKASLQFWRSVCGLIVMISTIYSLKTLSLAEFTLIFFTSPLLGVGLSAVFFQDRLRMQNIQAMTLAFLGVYVMIGQKVGISSGSDMGYGYGYACLAAVACAGVSLLGKRTTQYDDPYVYMFYYTLMCGVYGFFSLGIQGKLMHVPQGGHFIVLIVMAGLNFAGNVLINQALKQESLSKLMPFHYLSLVFATFWGYILWQHVPNATTLMGGGLIVIAMIMNSFGLASLRKQRV